MKGLKKLSLIFVAFVFMFTSVGYTKAADVIDDGVIADDSGEPFFVATDPSKKNQYYWAKLKTSEGKVAYCYDITKTWPSSSDGVSYNDTIDSMDAGLVYILEHGAANPSNPTNEERFVTQGAIWLYHENSNSFSPEFTDPHGLLARIRDLVTAAKQANTSGQGISNGIINGINAASTYLTREGNYYVSSEITPSVSGVSSYSVSGRLDGRYNGPDDAHISREAIITDLNGNQKSTFSPGESFKVKFSVDGLEEINNSLFSFNVTVSINTRAHMISPVGNTGYQRVISLSDTERSVSKSLDLTLAPVCVDYKIVGSVIPDPNLTDPTPDKSCYDKGTNYNQEKPLTTRTDCTFKGWYTSENLTGTWTDGTALNQDMTLYGAWECPEKVVVPPTAAGTSMIILGFGLLSVAGGFGYYVFKKKHA